VRKTALVQVQPNISVEEKFKADTVAFLGSENDYQYLEETCCRQPGHTFSNHRL